MKTAQSEYFDRFDRLFDDVYENISNGWRSLPVNDFHVAVIVYQRILLECMDNDNKIEGNGDSLCSVERLRQIKLWVAGYTV